MKTNIAIEEFKQGSKYSGAEIFVIDDEQLVVDTLTYFLRSAGFKRVQGFADSAEAIAKMRFVRPDVIFTDIRMPGINGNMFTKMARGVPHLQNVPIIAVTADHSFETSRQIIDAGAESVLIKPVAREILVQRTVHAIENASCRRYVSETESSFSQDKAFDLAEIPNRSLQDVVFRQRRRNRFRE